MRLIKNARLRSASDDSKSLIFQGKAGKYRTNDGEPATPHARLAPGGRSTDGCLTGA